MLNSLRRVGKRVRKSVPASATLVLRTFALIRSLCVALFDDSSDQRLFPLLIGARGSGYGFVVPDDFAFGCY